MSLESRIAKLSGRVEQLEKDYDKKKTELKKQEKRLVYIEEAQVLIQLAAKETQNTFKVHLEDIVQTALDACFPGSYDFFLNFILKGRSTVCDIYLENKYGNRISPKDSNGGGVVDILSLALRLAVWTLTKSDNVLVLDEPFKWLSASIRPLGAEMLQQLSTKLKMQLIIITHDLKTIGDLADKIFHVFKNKKLVSIVKVRGGE